MNILKKLKAKISQSRRNAIFAKCIVMYFSDVAFNDGAKTQFIFDDIIDTDAFMSRVGKHDYAHGIQKAIDIIHRYRRWEGESWRR